MKRLFPSIGQNDPRWPTMRKLNRVWYAMRARCEKPTDPAFRDYGNRGITVCQEWRTFPSFYRWATEAGYRPGLTLERLDNDKGYGPTNCAWVTQQEQNFNQRTNNVLEYRGKLQPLAAWAREVGLSPDVLERRLNKLHWPLERALTTPVRGWGPGRPRHATP